MTEMCDTDGDTPRCPVGVLHEHRRHRPHLDPDQDLVTDATLTDDGGYNVIDEVHFDTNHNGVTHAPDMFTPLLHSPSCLACPPCAGVGAARAHPRVHHHPKPAARGCSSPRMRVSSPVPAANLLVERGNMCAICGGLQVPLSPILDKAAV